MNTVNFSIAGMHCAGCVRRVTSALEGVDGVSELTVEIGSARFGVEDAEGIEEATRAVKALGFEVTSTSSSSA
jgi:copper chaperone CopZ